MVGVQNVRFAQDSLLVSVIKHHPEPKADSYDVLNRECFNHPYSSKSLVPSEALSSLYLTFQVSERYTFEKNG